MKTFTIEEANAALPLVRAIVSDLARLSQEVTERRQRVSFLLSNRERNESDPYWQELAAVEASLETDSARLREYVDELRQLGIEPKSAVDGVVDFSRLPLEIAWGRTTLNPTAVALATQIIEPVHEGPN